MRTPWRDGLPMFIVYDHPRDFPGEFVVRAMRLMRQGDKTWTLDEGIVARGATLVEVREQLWARRPGLVCLSRDEGDDPAIVEVWV